MDDRHLKLQGVGASIVSSMCWFPFLARCIYLETQPQFMFRQHSMLRRSNLLNIQKTAYRDYFKFFANNYRGYKPVVFAQFFYPILDATTSYTSRTIGRILGSGVETNNTQKAAAVVTGALSVIVSSPVKSAIIVMQQQQTTLPLALQNTTCGTSTRYKIKEVFSLSNMLCALRHTVETAGIAGLYRGGSLFVVKSVTSRVALITVTPMVMQHNICGSGGSGGNSHCRDAFRTILPAFVSTLVSMPADVINSMRLSDPQCRLYKSSADAIAAAVKGRGLSGLFVGFKYRFAATAIEFYMYTRLFTAFSAF
jgi:hypothetical protein